MVAVCAVVVFIILVAATPRIAAYLARDLHRARRIALGLGVMALALAISTCGVILVRREVRLKPHRQRLEHLVAMRASRSEVRRQVASWPGPGFGNLWNALTPTSPPDEGLIPGGLGLAPLPRGVQNHLQRAAAADVFIVGRSYGDEEFAYVVYYDQVGIATGYTVIELDFGERAWWLL